MDPVLWISRLNKCIVLVKVDLDCLDITGFEGLDIYRPEKLFAKDKHKNLPMPGVYSAES